MAEWPADFGLHWYLTLSFFLRVADLPIILKKFSPFQHLKTANLTFIDLNIDLALFIVSPNHPKLSKLFNHMVYRYSAAISTTTWHGFENCLGQHFYPSQLQQIFHLDSYFQNYLGMICLL